MRHFIRPALAAVVVAPLFLGASAFAMDSAANFIKHWDPDHDGTLDLNEIYKAADAEFAKLDTDHDGTLDLKELIFFTPRVGFLFTDTRPIEQHPT